MKIVLGILAGIIWGTAAAFLDSRIMKYTVQKNSTNSIMIGNMLRMLVDVAALGIVFLLRNVLPFHFVAALAATAVSLSIATIVFSFMLARPAKTDQAPAAESADSGTDNNE